AVVSCKTPGLKTDSNRFCNRKLSVFRHRHKKRLAKPFYRKTPGLKTDSNRFYQQGDLQNCHTVILSLINDLSVIKE
ncbi:MAG: hypothetical protein BWK80_39170, partial [Desulfobacteraceae bacterium IS3]